MTILKDVELDFSFSVREIFEELDSSEKEELLEMILDQRGYNQKNFFIESLITGKSDSDILNDKKIWDKLIYFIKYDEPALKDYIIEELSYEPKLK